MPYAGSRVVRIDPLHILARCRTKRLNQAIFVLYLSMFYCVVIYLGTFLCIVSFHLCSVFWLFWLSCHYLPSDWLERPL